MTAPTPRQAHTLRTTAETRVEATLVLDGSGRAEVATGVPFLDHMLVLFAVHGLFDLTLKAAGDVEIDDHHTVEDVGIVLGQVLSQALGDRRGIRRYGQATVPMDETLARVAVDLSNRPYLHLTASYPHAQVGRFDTGLVRELLRALCQHGGLTLHVEVPYGADGHHMIEAQFKALGRALDEASSLDPRRVGLPSSKGLL
ncbi:MAG: imidazoleglycerol-phosphate dehydratase HisB [Thermodesulfobacteriota bacterium]